MNLYGVFTVSDGLLLALFRNAMAARFYIDAVNRTGIGGALEVEEINAYDAMKMFGREM